MAASAATYDWNKTRNYPQNDPPIHSYLWMDGANWGDGTGIEYPEAGDTANITPLLEGNLTVTFSGNPSVGILNVGDGGEGLYTMTLGAGSTSANLTLNADGGTAQINKSSGNLVVVNKRLYFTSDTVISVAAGELRLSGERAEFQKAGAVAVEGAGLLVFAADATDTQFSTLFTGNLSLRANGTLLVNNTFAVNTTGAAATVLVENTGRLGGSGTVGRKTTVESGGRLDPGSAPGAAGVLSFTDGLTLESGAQFQFELKGNTAAGRGTAFDGVDVSAGSLEVEEGAIFNLTFNGAGSTVDFADVFWSADQEWLIFDNTNAAALGAFTLGTPTVDSLGNPFAITGGAFGFKQSGNDLYLTYQVIPEPGSALLLLGGGLAMAAARLRRI